MEKKKKVQQAMLPESVSDGLLGKLSRAVILRVCGMVNQHEL